MKTLLISEVFPPQVGGSGKWFWEIYSRLPREEIVVAAGDHHPDAPAFDESHDIDIMRVPLKMPEWGVKNLRALSDYSRLFMSLRSAAKRRGITQIHAGRVLPEGWLALMLSKWLGLPYSAFVHGEEMQHAQTSREHTWMIRRVIAGAEYLIANSHNTRKILETNWDVPTQQIRVLHPGVDTTRFVPVDRDPAMRDSLGWQDRPVLLTVGRLQPRKGQDMVIRALQQIRQQIPDVLYCICGGGEDKERLQALTQELGLQQHVQFPGEITDEQLLGCFQQCDVFVLANRTEGTDIEGFGIVLLEAQACGKPVVAGMSGGTAETMKIGESGEVLDCTDPAALAELLTSLLRDETRRQQMGTAAHEWANSQFDWQTLAEQAYHLFSTGEVCEPHTVLETASR